jgi:Protein of unknown function (DUF4435)
MSRPRFTSKDYQNHIKMSNSKHLLVEGPNDKDLFNILMYEFDKTNQNRSRPKIVIDTVKEIDVKGEGILGHRAQVEFIYQKIESKSLSDKSLADKLVGFVDREFREFEYKLVFRDNRPEHVVQGRLVWSRGHSIENYFFDISILEELLFSISSNDFDLELFYTAFEKFKSAIDATIRLACATSLAAEECQVITRIKDRCIDFKFIRLNNSNKDMSIDVVFDIEEWTKDIFKTEDEKANDLYNSWLCWSRKLVNVDLSVIRWLCHGHIGMQFIRSVYAHCVYDSAIDNQFQKPDAEVRKIEKYNAGDRFKACATSWSKKAISNQCEYPIEVLKLLGF